MTGRAGGGRPEFLEEKKAGSGECGIWFQTSGGKDHWAAGRTAAVVQLWKSLGVKEVPPPLSFHRALERVKENAIVAEVGDLTECETLVSKEDFPWACYFDLKHDEEVRKLVEKLQEAARSA